MLIAERYESPSYEGDATGPAGAYPVLESQICWEENRTRIFWGFFGWLLNKQMWSGITIFNESRIDIVRPQTRLTWESFLLSGMS